MVTYFEDIEVGDTFEPGTHTVTEAEIIEFAEQYDPLSFHIDREAARSSIYGDLIASGLHTVSITFRLMGDLLWSETFMGARGWDDVRFLAPVRPGDTLSVRAEVEETRVPPDGHPERGDVDLRLETSNAEGRTVLSLLDLIMIRRRDPR